MFSLSKNPRFMLLVVGLLWSGLASAAEQATIYFANHAGSIRDWQSDSQNELFVQDIHRQWYRATFWAPCWGLPFAIAVGFRTGTMDRIDQYSSVIVEGERCTFRTFEKSDPPPPSEKHNKKQAKGDKEPEKVPEAGDSSDAASGDKAGKPGE